MTAWHQGDCVKGLRATEGASLELVVTSPPYGTLRNYGGHPFTEETFLAVAEQLWRCVRPGGVVCWQEGDQMVRGTLTDAPHRHLLHFRRLGFSHYETIVMAVKGSRPICRHYSTPPQYVWVMSKGRPKTVHILDKRNKSSGTPNGAFTWRLPDGSRRILARDRDAVVRERGPRSCYWFYHSASHTEPELRWRHDATMHQLLARDLIESYSNRHDRVCDPFGGVATTGKWAVLLGRDFLGFEQSEFYHAWGQHRLDRAVDQARREALAALPRRLSPVL